MFLDALCGLRRDAVKFDDVPVRVLDIAEMNAYNKIPLDNRCSRQCGSYTASTLECVFKEFGVQLCHSIVCLFVYNYVCTQAVLLQHCPQFRGLIRARRKHRRTELYAVKDGSLKFSHAIVITDAKLETAPYV